MIEKEYAGIIRTVLELTGNPAAYYHNIPENFIVPSVFFPVPEIETVPDTLDSYGAEYTVFAMFFGSTTENAYELGLPVYNGINAARKLVPLYENDGRYTGESLRIKEISFRKADECACQMQISWISRRICTRPEADLIENFYLNGGKNL